MCRSPKGHQQLCVRAQHCCAPGPRDQNLTDVFGFSSYSLSTFNCRLSTLFLHLLFHYFFTRLSLHRFSLTAAVCSNEPTVLHPLSVFSNLCETSYPHPRTGHTQNLTFRPTAKSPI